MPVCSDLAPSFLVNMQPSFALLDGFEPSKFLASGAELRSCATSVILVIFVLPFVAVRGTRDAFDLLLHALNDLPLNVKGFPKAGWSSSPVSSVRGESVCEEHAEIRQCVLGFSE